jgi:hypothetical protein
LADEFAFIPRFASFRDLGVNNGIDGGVDAFHDGLLSVKEGGELFAAEVAVSRY